MRVVSLPQSLPESRSFLTSNALAVGNIVALDSSNLLIKADRTNPAKIAAVGFATKATAAGPVVTTSVQFGGIIQSGTWNFAALGQPVFLDTAGGVTQDTTGFSTTDYIVQVGVAVGVNQILIGIKDPVSVGIQVNSRYAVSSKSLYQVTGNKANLSVAARTTGKLAAWTDSATIGSVDNLTLPNETGTLLTDASIIVGIDYS